MEKTHFYHYCLQGFTRQDLLAKHMKYCSKHDPQHVELPNEKENDLEFKDFDKQLKVPFVIYAGFETFAKKWTHVCRIRKNRAARRTSNSNPVVRIPSRMHER